MDESSYSTDWKRYIAAAAASVCGTDAELSAMLLEQVDFRSETAVDGLQRIDRQGDFDRRGAEDGSDHPLRYLRTGGRLSRRGAGGYPRRRPRRYPCRTRSPGGYACPGRGGADGGAVRRADAPGAAGTEAHTR